MSTPDDDAEALDAAEPLDAGVADEAGDVALELLLDEQAASSIAAPIAVTPNAARVTFAFRLSVLKRSMRPRIAI